MAIIKCPECGYEISDKATSCVSCGCPIVAEKRYGAFSLIREEKMFFCLAKYDVFLDNMRWGTLKNGDSLNTTLECGVHHLKLIDIDNFRKVVYDSDFTINEDGIMMSFSASMKLKMSISSNPNKPNPLEVRNPLTEVKPQQTYSTATPQRKCPKCGGNMSVQVVSESRKMGCGTILLYLILALTVFGILIVIPLMLRAKTKTTTYAVCNNCGHKIHLN